MTYTTPNGAQFCTMTGSATTIISSVVMVLSGSTRTIYIPFLMMPTTSIIGISIAGDTVQIRAGTYYGPLVYDKTDFDRFLDDMSKYAGGI